jgi:hypothetical protein
MEPFAYLITARKGGETKIYTRIGDERASALSSDLARLGYRVEVRLAPEVAR